MPAIRFTAELVPDSGYTFLYIPSDLLGTRRRVRVKGTINGHPFASSAQVWRDGQHLITVNRRMREAMGLRGGEQVEVELEIDTKPAPPVEAPDDLMAALRDHDGAEAVYRRFPPSHQKRYIDWVEEAKRPETRARRIQQTVEMILSKAGGPNE